MKVVRIKRHPMGHNFYAINLFGVVFSIGPLSPVERNHEYIHTLQQRELLFIPFYLIYLAEWLVRYMQHRNWLRAYEHISFEREAYTMQHDLDYKHHRPFMAWCHYLHSKG